MCTLFNSVVNYSDVIRWLKGFMLTCPSKKLLHIECPGCGFQSSFFALFEGHFYQIVQLYPALLPILLLVSFTVLHLKYNYSFGALIIKYLFSFIVIIVVVFYSLKCINHKIFC